MKQRCQSSMACWVIAALLLGFVPLHAEPPPLDGAVIVVDPGHGGQRYSKSYTGGTRGVVSKVTESELNLRVAEELEKTLKEKGATVYMTRRGDHRLSPEGSTRSDELQARIDFFDHFGSHFFLSVHHNAGGGGNAGGHTTLYKNNAKDVTLYQALAEDINNALEGAVPGPKNALIGKTPYYILGHTSIPGTISEAGFMTNRAFDELSMRPDFPRKEAEAICNGAMKYWKEHKNELNLVRAILQQERAERPRDPKSYKAIDLNPDYQATMKKLLAQVTPSGKYEPAMIGEYLESYRKTIDAETRAKFGIQGEFDGKLIKLTGEVANKKHHDDVINLLIAMKLYNISNNIRLPKTP